jgi:hypothetical protein
MIVKLSKFVIDKFYLDTGLALKIYDYVILFRFSRIGRKSEAIKKVDLV